jgi:biotin carboxyl carrier protein
VEVETGGEVWRVEARASGGAWTVDVGTRSFALDAARSGGRWSLLVQAAGSDEVEEEDGRRAGPSGPAIALRSFDVLVEDRNDGQFVVYVDGRAVALSVPHLRRAGGSTARRTSPEAPVSGRIVAPMPGRIVRVLVKPGDVVEAGQGTVVVEAMKMENELRSPKRGTVTSVTVTEGTLVEARRVLVVVE